MSRPVPHILTAVLLFAASVRAQERVRLGQTAQEVLDMLGEPTGKMEMGDSVILVYPEGSVTLAGGVVTKAPKKKIRKREPGASGSPRGGPRPSVWPPPVPVTGRSSLKEVAEVIPGYGHLETAIVAEAERNRIALSPEAVRAESLRVWTDLLGRDGESAMARFAAAAKAYRDKNAVKAKFDYTDKNEMSGQAKCGAPEAWTYMSALPAGGGTGAECWTLGKEQEFARQYSVGAYDYGHTYDKKVWVRSHWDQTNGRWDSLSADQQDAFKSEFSDALEKEISVLKGAEAKPVDASKARSERDLVGLYAGQFRYRAYERFLAVLRDVPLPPP